MDNPADNDAPWNYRSEQEEQATEEAFNQAVSLVLSGQSIAQVLDGMNLPEAVKDQLRKRLQQAVQEKEIREHRMAQETREVAAEKTSAIGKFFSMSMIASAISKNALERIQKVFGQNPTLANQVKEQGRILLKSGAMPDLDFKPGQSVSAPTVGIGKGKQQEQGR